MYISAPPKEKLRDLLDLPFLSMRQRVTQLSSIRPHLDREDPVFETPYGELKATRVTTETLGSFAGAPVTFMRKVSPDLRQLIMTEMLSSDDPVILEISAGEIVSAHEPDGRYIPLGPVVNVALDVLGHDASVISRGFMPQRGRVWLDAVVLDMAPGEMGVIEGGDHEARVEIPGGEPRVGDLTRAGLSFFRKSISDEMIVSLFLERLACTNGMVSRYPGTEFRLKGSTAEEIIDQMESAARRAFDSGREAIESFYELRNHPVTGDVTQLVARSADAIGLSDAQVRAMVYRAPEIDDKATVFDVVNLFTNQANRPDITAPVRRLLTTGGGQLAASGHPRCHACQQQL